MLQIEVDEVFDAVRRRIGAPLELLPLISLLAGVCAGYPLALVVLWLASQLRKAFFRAPPSV